MQTIVILIGNSDDKLTQKEWCEFVGAVNAMAKAAAKEVHFSGTSCGAAPWQNAAWVLAMDTSDYSKIEGLKMAIRAVGNAYNQDSVAWIEGVTKFIDTKEAE